MKSKRAALRFSCKDVLLNVKTAYDEGEARLLNISTAGCAFEEPSLTLALQEKVLISITFPEDGYVFEAQGMVVRQDLNSTAVYFTLVEKEDQVKMRNHFSKKMRTKSL